MQLHATNLARHGYGKGWQVNALVEGVESEATFYGTSKEWALRQAKAIIENEGRLPHEPYRESNAIFKGFKVTK
jgi:hypothetical protein